ncbi:MAG TPA: TrkA family potassium uptake protein [Noviherbaspirillum sp.]|nr:TrkA family potassium uptake protein [Noviherbaspirillum sp.]
MKNTITVIGLGIFGSTIALELTRLGHDVLGIDINPKRVADIADRITQAVVADARDERVLNELGVPDSDVVVVAIGEDIEANILASLLADSMPKPRVWAKALNHNHHQILSKIGTDYIIHPEHEMGLRVARTLIYPEVVDYISLGDDLFISEVRASERLIGKKLEHLHLDEYGVQCLMVKHHGLAMSPPQSEYLLELGDQIVLFGTLGQLRKIAKYL